MFNHATPSGCAERVIVVNKGNNAKMVNKFSDNVTFPDVDVPASFISRLRT